MWEVQSSRMAAAWIGTSAAVVFVILIFVLKHWNWWRYAPRLRKDQAPLPPGDMGWPVVGQILDFLQAFKSQNPDSFIGNLRLRYGRTGLYRTHLFGQPTVLATTSERIKQVLMDGRSFKSGWPKSTRTVMGRKSFVVLEGEEHRRLRRITTCGVQGPEALNGFIPTVEKLCKEKLESWAAEKEFKLVDKLRQFTFEIIIQILMSYPDGPRAQSLLESFDAMVHGLRAMAINIPGTAYYRSLQHRKTVLRNIQDILDERRSSKEPKNKDILETLLNLEDENGARLTDEEVIDTLLVFIMAGHQSSTFSMAWVMIFLQRHPEMLQKAREEQLKIHEATQSRDHLTFSDFKKMTFLNDVIDETLRIVNVTPFVFREALETIEIGGYTVPKGWFVETWFRAVHLDPEVYAQPYDFKPDRWRTFKPQPGQFVPFGLGNRNCIGSELAKLEMSIFLHYVILNYKWEPLDGATHTKYLPHPQPADGYRIQFSRL